MVARANTMDGTVVESRLGLLGQAEEDEGMRNGGRDERWKVDVANASAFAFRCVSVALAARALAGTAIAAAAAAAAATRMLRSSFLLVHGVHGGVVRGGKREATGDWRLTAGEGRTADRPDTNEVRGDKWVGAWRGRGCTGRSPLVGAPYR